MGGEGITAVSISGKGAAPENVTAAVQESGSPAASVRQPPGSKVTYTAPAKQGRADPATYSSVSGSLNNNLTGDSSQGEMSLSTAPSTQTPAVSSAPAYASSPAPAPPAPSSAVSPEASSVAPSAPSHPPSSSLPQGLQRAITAVGTPTAI
jgi:hypothetical protein